MAVGGMYALYYQGLKYNFLGRELFRSPGPQFIPGAPVHFLGTCFNGGFSNYYQ